MSQCGFCGSAREAGGVCCADQARNQGRLHAACNHPPPDMPEEWLAAYDEGQAQALAEIEAAHGLPTDRLALMADRLLAAANLVNDALALADAGPTRDALRALYASVANAPMRLGLASIVDDDGSAGWAIVSPPDPDSTEADAPRGRKGAARG